MSKVNRVSKSFVKLIVGVVIIIVIAIAILQGIGWMASPVMH